MFLIYFFNNAINKQRFTGEQVYICEMVVLLNYDEYWLSTINETGRHSDIAGFPQRINMG